MKLTNQPLDSEIPTSSMADIAFLLIIYFMLTATFAATRGLDLALPDEEIDPPLIDLVESVLVEVDPTGGLVVDRQTMPLGDLLAYLRPRLEQNPDKPVVVRPASEAGYGAVVGVLDELRQGKDRLGLERDINIALPTEREIALFWPV